MIAKELRLLDENIKSVRTGGIISVHEILFGFFYPTVRLKPESIARGAFGNGVLFAIQNLQGKAKGWYSMWDLLLPYFKLETNEVPNIQAPKKRWWEFWHAP